MVGNAVLLDTRLRIPARKDKLYLLKSSKNSIYKVSCLSLILIALFAFWKLDFAERNLTSVRELVNKTPVTLTFKDDIKTKGIVFLAHGFAGSTSFMRPIAVALAEAGYLTVRFDFLGHGRHPLPYSGDITTIAGATQKFVSQTDEIISHYLAKYDNSFSMIIGHSMASDIIFRVARANENIYGAIGLSNYTNEITADKPENVLIINGAWETRLRDEALKIFKDIGKISNSDHTVLIRGESGTGKEMIGRAIHTNSLNNKGPYIQVNVTAIPGDLLESELFGYEKGAFTGAEKKKSGRFEEADNGTILLDEIGDMSIDLQSKLLRVIEEKKFYKLGSQKPTSFNCRIIASTNKNLEELINEKKFRDDLFYRLNTISIDIPPLRDRKEDIPHLISYFLEKYPDHNNGIKTVDNEIIEIFMKYEWPGNVRELENTIKKLIIMSNNSHLTADDIDDHFPKIYEVSSDNFANLNYNLLIDTILTKDESDENKYQNILKKVKTTIIESTLIKFKGDKKKTTDELGINNKDFDKLLKDLKISQNLFKSD